MFIYIILLKKIESHLSVMKEISMKINVMGKDIMLIMIQIKMMDLKEDGKL